MSTLGGIVSEFARRSLAESGARARAQIERLNRSAEEMNKFSEDGTPMEDPKPNEINKMLEVRKNTYGDYSVNARVTQMVMNILMEGANSGALTYMHKEGLHMIAHKMSRIVNGDPNHHDSWDDIIGYAKCVVDRIPGRPEKKT